MVDLLDDIRRGRTDVVDDDVTETSSETVTKQAIGVTRYRRKQREDAHSMVVSL